ncbi:hypothetical protein [Acidiferrobacter sp.]|uniref:hypothetical protein n=1 Tax=Acidiferrobacter sp. TaxID=1872107 RepID=UPI00261A1461|nr:hypothetical protein [Acidiferrobacter sp.]
MTDVRHYLQLRFSGQVFLMPNLPDIVVEPRENMLVEPKGQAAARRSVQGASWVAYALGPDWTPVPEGPWTRAVFLGIHGARPVGLLVDDLKLLPAIGLRIEPFTPLGPAPVPGRNLFPGVEMRQGNPTLVLAADVLASYLHALEGNHGLGQ